MSDSHSSLPPAPAASEPVSSSPEETSPVSGMPAVPRSKPENPLLNLLLNVLLPVVVLTNLNKDTGFPQLGPKGALVVALLFPIGYQIYDYWLRRKWNLFSLIGFISVLLTGGLGLMTLSAQVFAWKEASIPLVLAALIFFSHKTKKPLLKTLLLNPEMMDMPRLEAAVARTNSQREFEKLLWTSTLLLTASMLLSAVLNYFLALYFLQGKTPGTSEYTAAIGAQTGWGYLVVGVPTLAITIFAFWWLIRGLKRLTGMGMEELMLPR